MTKEVLSKAYRLLNQIRQLTDHLKTFDSELNDNDSREIIVRKEFIDLTTYRDKIQIKITELQKQFDEL